MGTNFEWQAMFAKYIVGATQALVNAEACPPPCPRPTDTHFCSAVCVASVMPRTGKSASLRL